MQSRLRFQKRSLEKFPKFTLRLEISTVRSRVTKPFSFAARPPLSSGCWVDSFIYLSFLLTCLLFLSFCCTTDCPTFPRGRTMGNQIIYGNGILTCDSLLERRKKKFGWYVHTVKLKDDTKKLLWKCPTRLWNGQTENILTGRGTNSLPLKIIHALVRISNMKSVYTCVLHISVFVFNQFAKLFFVR